MHASHNTRTEGALQRSLRVSRPFSAAAQRTHSLVPEETLDSPQTESPEAATAVLPELEVA